MYEFSSRVRYSEIGSDRKMTITALITRLQDCCVFQLDSVGRGPEIWQREKRGWIIVSWQVKLFELPEFGSLVTARTIPYRFHGFEGDRNFEVFASPCGGERAGTGPGAAREGGEEPVLCAVANSRWVFYDMERQIPIRVPEEEKANIPLDPPLDMECSPRRIRLPETEPVLLEPVRVTETFIDTNYHVNNLRYIEMACACLPEDFRWKELRVEYLRQCRLGETICPRVYRTDDAVYAALCSQDGAACAVVMFL